MQSILSTISTGPSSSGVRCVIAGQEKIGKTTIACGAPNSLLIPLEVGFSGIQTAKVSMIQTFEGFLQLLDEITYYAQNKQFPYRSLVLDSGTGLERLIHDYVLRQDPASKTVAKKTLSMESAHGGYGRAYTLANDNFNAVLQKLDLLAVYGSLNIIITCHVFSSKVQDPTAGEYDSWDLLLHSPKNAKTYGKREMITQWADMIGFLYEPVYITKADPKSLSIATSQNKGRMLGLSRTPAYTAGNRYGIIGEVPIPAPPDNGWNHLAHALHQKTGIDVFTR